MSKKRKRCFTERICTTWLCKVFLLRAITSVVIHMLTNPGFNRMPQKKRWTLSGKLRKPAPEDGGGVFWSKCNGLNIQGPFFWLDHRCVWSILMGTRRWRNGNDLPGKPWFYIHIYIYYIIICVYTVSIFTNQITTGLAYAHWSWHFCWQVFLFGWCHHGRRRMRL